MQARFIQEIGTRAYLRIYWGDSSQKVCPKGGYHNVMKHLLDSGNLADWDLGGRMADYPDPGLWPTHCEHCGAPVPAGYFLSVVRPWITGPDGEVVPDYSAPVYQVFRQRLYNTQSGQPEPGDLYVVQRHNPGECPFWDDCDGVHLFAVLPNSREWEIDGRASNCTHPQDRQHRCWVRHGTPPLITVDKAGKTCNAGAGSIAMGNYHGFLRSGQFT